MKELRAYRIMIQFLEDRYFRGPTDDLGGLLGDLTLLQDGKPADTAMTQDWERAVRTVDSQNPGDFGEGLKLF